MSSTPASRSRATAGTAGPSRSCPTSAATSGGRRTVRAGSGSGATTTTSPPCPVAFTRRGRARRTWCRVPTPGRQARTTTRTCSTSTSRAPTCPTTSTRRRTRRRPSPTRACRKEASTRTSTAQVSDRNQRAAKAKDRPARRRGLSPCRDCFCFGDVPPPDEGDAHSEQPGEQDDYGDREEGGEEQQGRGKTPARTSATRTAWTTTRG